MNKNLKRKVGGYSLLELIATVTILVALATVMFPYVQVNKQEIYDTTEIYNMSGTHRYLEMYSALYGGTGGELGTYNCYPTSFSTGLAADLVAAVGNAGPMALDTLYLLDNIAVPALVFGAADVVDETGDTVVVKAANMVTVCPTTAPTPLTLAEGISLYKAGIRSLNYLDGNDYFDTGAPAAADLSALDTTGGIASLAAATLDDAGTWFNCYRYNHAGSPLAVTNSGNTLNAAKTGVDAGSDPITLKGYAPANWVANLATEVSTTANDVTIIYLFVTPLIEWDTYYANPSFGSGAAPVIDFKFMTEKSASIRVPIPASSPWMPSDSFRNYIAVFAAHNAPQAITLANGTNDDVLKSEFGQVNPAKLLGILSPADLSTATP